LKTLRVFDFVLENDSEYNFLDFGPQILNVETARVGTDGRPAYTIYTTRRFT